MSWLTFAVLSLVLASLAAIAQATVVKRSQASSLTLSMLYIGFSRSLLVVYAIVFLGSVSLAAALDAWWLIVLNVLLFPAAHILTFKGLKYLDASLQTIALSSWVLYTVIGSTIILNESISVQQWIGLTFILSGVVLAHARGKESKNIHRGLVLTFFAALFYGAGGIVDKLFFDRVSMGTFFVFSSGSTGLALIIMYIVHQKVYKKPLMPSYKSVYWRYVIIGALLLLVSDATYFEALDRLDNIALLTAVNTFSVILTVLLGIVLLKEKDHIRTKLVAAVIATIGFLLLI